MGGGGGGGGGFYSNGKDATISGNGVGGEAQDIFRGVRVECMREGSEVALVFIIATRDRAEVEVTVGEVAGLKEVSCGGGGGPFNKGANQLK